MNFGDYTTGGTVSALFTTRTTGGVPSTLSNGTAVVYKNAGTVESGSGVTLTANFDARTGVNAIVIDTSTDGTFYSTNAQFDIVLTTGTVNSVSVGGEVIGRFTLGNQAAKAVASVSGSVASVSGSVASVSGSVASVSGSVASVSGSVASVSGSVASVSGTVGSVAGGVGGNVANVTGTVGGNILGSVVGSVASVSGTVGTVVTIASPQTFNLTGNITGNLSGSVGNVAGNVGNVTGTVGGNVLGSVVGSVGTVASITSTERDAVADALLNRDMSAVSDTNSRSPLNALRMLRNKVDIASGTLSVSKEDDSTNAWQSVVTTDATAEPIISSDPT